MPDETLITHSRARKLSEDMPDAGKRLRQLKPYIVLYPKVEKFSNKL